MARNLTLSTDAYLGRDPAAVRKRIEMMERLLENMVTVPILNGGSVWT